MTSKVTSKYQVTIPKDIREHLHLSVNGAIEWSIQGGKITVTKADAPFLARQGSLKVGKGNIETDIELAKSLYGKRA